MRLSMFIVGLIVLSLFSVVGVLYLSKINTYYPLANTSKIDNINNTYNKLIELEDLQENVTSSISNITAEPGLLDIFGGFFRSAIVSVKLAATSVDTATQMGQQSLDELPLGNSTRWFSIALGSILFIVIFIGVVLSVMTRREL